jgi:GGDEF domain-containing protein
MTRPPLPDGDPTVAVLRDALDAMDDHVTLLDPDGRLLHVNRAWRAFATQNGWAGSAWPGMDYIAATEASEDPDARRIAAGLRAVLRGEQDVFHAEYPCHSPDELRWFDMRATGLQMDGVGALIVHTDITQRRLAERALEHAASHDEVTGLANRRLLQRRLEELLVANSVGVLVVRLHGHDPASAPQLSGARDTVLRQTATLVDQLFAAPAVTGRYGLDHFVVLLPDHDVAALARLAVTVTAGWRARLGDHDGVDVSVGRAIATPGDDARRVLARAALDARPARRLAGSPVGLDGLAGRPADDAPASDGLAGPPPRDAVVPPPLDEPVRVDGRAGAGRRSARGRAQASGADPAPA